MHITEPVAQTLYTLHRVMPGIAITIHQETLFDGMEVRMEFPRPNDGRAYVSRGLIRPPGRYRSCADHDKTVCALLRNTARNLLDGVLS